MHATCRARLCLTTAVSLVLAATPALAATISWTNPGTGSWFTAGNWNPTQVPAALDQAIISNGGTATALAAQTPTAFRIDVGTAAVAGTTGTGTLNAAGTVSGLATVGSAFTPLGQAAASATGVVTIGGDAALAAFSPFLVGGAFNGGSTASGAVTIDGTLRTSTSGGFPPQPQAWQIGTAIGASANGSVIAGAVDTTAAAVAFLGVGSSSEGGTATGALTLGSGNLTLAGSVAIGLANIDQGGSATGTVTLGGALVTTGAPALLQVGSASGMPINGIDPGSAEGSLTASGILGVRNVLIGTTTTAQNGTGVTALGTATIGAGGIVTDPSGGSVRIGRAEDIPVNGVVTGPGASAEGNATVAGDIAGYSRVEIGHVVNTGTARGSLSVTGGTIAAALLSAGEVQRSGATINAGLADAEGTLSVTNGAIVAETVRIGRGSVFGGFVPTDSAVGSATLSGSSLSTTFLQIGTLGGKGSLQASVGSSIVANAVVIGSDGASGNGSGTVTLQNGSFTVAAVPNSLQGSMFVGSEGGDAAFTAQASTVSVAGALAIGASSFDGTSHARMALQASTLSVGGALGIGSFEPGSRAELVLADSTATVGGNVRVGQSANFGTLFGEALLSVDASFLDIAGTLTMDLGAETRFGIGGTLRGLGGYGAIDALSATLDGLITVDFAGLVGFDLDSFDFDLISVLRGFTGDFATTQFLNLPTGYAVTFYGIALVGEIDVWRVTLAQVPEPGALALLLAGLAGLALTLRRRAA
jgi:filamentous hemagglutinin